MRFDVTSYEISHVLRAHKTHCRKAPATDLFPKKSEYSEIASILDTIPQNDAVCDFVSEYFSVIRRVSGYIHKIASDVFLVRGCYIVKGCMSFFCMNEEIFQYRNDLGVGVMAVSSVLRDRIKIVDTINNEDHFRMMINESTPIVQTIQHSNRLNDTWRHLRKDDPERLMNNRHTKVEAICVNIPVRVEIEVKVARSMKDTFEHKGPTFQELKDVHKDQRFIDADAKFPVVKVTVVMNGLGEHPGVLTDIDLFQANYRALWDSEVIVSIEVIQHHLRSLIRVVPITNYVTQTLRDVPVRRKHDLEIIHDFPVMLQQMRHLREYTSMAPVHKIVSQINSEIKS